MRSARGGAVWTLGPGEEPRAVIEVRDASVLTSILRNPALRFGETFMEGGWNPVDGSLLSVLEAGLALINSVELTPRERQLMKLRGHIGEINSPFSSRRNVAHHYDLDRELYAAFLDAGLFYSCAYYREPGMDLEAAQQAKCAHIAAKLDLRPGARVLDIGCGWGGLAMYLAEHHGVHVTGITLSKEQLAVARQRVNERGLDSRVELRLEDYRLTEGRFDAVVSVGMFEHVGRPQYPKFFRRVRELLKADGVALLHTIGRSTPPGFTNPWIRKHIFPGGYIPAASEVLEAIEAEGLVVSDLEIWRLHYAWTLAEWHRRFQAERELFRARFGERFCRMWEFYLQASEASFRWGDLVVFHFQLLRDQTRLPYTRGYLYRGVVDGARASVEP
ncbi:cyclopropane-fatty-acyl-phospholipid synthase family protein [Hydrocarboniphaga sp.]|uniref:SAM-dependent methyltransferase n=1 Tax=Hydrocarboniphaga sp. TaxID=2033016 RepID=UPI00262356F1|nr:cyclopropane-fatty-acyl-phospholipid synthase family protein [Hydrocarboniphaga sp.]